MAEQENLTAEPAVMDSRTPQEILLPYLGKTIFVQNEYYKEPQLVTLKYIGESDIITADLIHFPFHQITVG